MKYFYPFVGVCTTLTAAPFSLFILNAASTNEIENAKHVEVFFYGKKSSSRSARSVRSAEDERLVLVSDDTAASSSSNVERIKVWIEDLDNFSKFQYCSSTSASVVQQSSDSGVKTETCTWKNFITLDQDSSEASKKSKYYFLAKLAKYFLLVQHNLNLLKGLNIEKNNWDLNLPTDCKICGTEESDKCCIPCKKCSENEKCNCCKEGEDCLIPCCLKCVESDEECKCECTDGEEKCKKNFEKNQKKFFFSLKNLTGIATNRYLTALQAHINLPDLDLSSDLSNVTINEGSSDSSSSDSKKSEKKNLNATLIYGFTDYYYKVSDEPNIAADFEKITKKKLDSSSESTSTYSDNNNGKKYFVNIPHQFSFTVSGLSNGTSTTKDSETAKSYDLVDLYKKLKEKQAFLDTFKTSNNSIKKTSDSKSEEEAINCLLKRNFVFLASKLENAKCFVECKAEE